jgi:tetratricopeptide (TPR) repeat protein
VIKTAKGWLGNSWAFVLVGGILTVLAFPHLVSAYHLEAGGRAVDDPERLATDPLPALAHLQKAIEWRPDNAQAYRLLAKVYRTQGDWPAAVESLTRYTELRPDNPLGHIELAEVYETVEAEMATMRLADLVAALPQAAVEAPDVPVDTPYVQPEGPAWHSYAATTAFSLPPNFGERPALFMHPPSRTFYNLTLPTEPAALRFGLGLAPEVTNWPGDGVTFEVLIDGQSVFQEHLDKALARQGWQERTVDVAPWAGREIVLSLGVGPGPVGDVSGDWAGWGEPQVVDVRLPAMEALHPVARAADEWLRAGVTAEDFIEAGEEARKAKRYDEALTWYQKAARLEPGLGDPWYFLGLVYEDQQRWLGALEAYDRAVADDRLDQVRDSSPHYRTGIIYQWRLDPRRTEEALAAYDAALAADEFDSEVQAADCHYKRGEVLRWQKADPDEYIAEFRQALELNPKHASAYILLGLAYYDRDKDATVAEAEILRALEMSPQSKWAYYHLGEIYRQEGRADEAAAMYQQALEIDPDFEAARKRLAALREGSE